MKNFFKHIYVSCVLFSLFFAGQVFAAEPTSCDGKDKLCNPLKVDSLDQLVVVLLELIVKVGSIVIVFYIIYSGFKLVMAQGKPEAIKDAKNALMYSLIGGAILLGAEAIALVLKDTVTTLGN